MILVPSFAVTMKRQKEYKRIYLFFICIYGLAACKPAERMRKSALCPSSRVTGGRSGFDNGFLFMRLKNRKAENNQR
jgi:hypothetical protein